MNNFSKFVILLFSLFLINSSMSAQFNNVRYGGEATISSPKRVEANSAGIKYSQSNIQYVSKDARNFIVSYDSDQGEIVVKENLDYSIQHQPFSVGTDRESFFGSAIKDDYNSETQAENLSFSMILESRSAGYSYAFDRGLSTFLADLSDLASSGYRIESIDNYGIYSQLYGGTWTKDNSGWTYDFNNTDANTFINALNQWPNGSTRYRPINFVFYAGASANYYGAVGKADSKGFGWVFGLGSLTALYDWVNDQYANSRRVIDIEVYRNLNGDTYFGGVSVSGTFAQVMVANYNYTDFLTEDGKNASDNYRLVDYERYYVNGSYLYSGVWAKDGTAGWWYYSFSNSTDFINAVSNKINEGYKPTMIQINDGDWTVDVTDEEEVSNTFSLSQNYPNPFNPSTEIKFSIPEQSFVSLSVYDVLGREISQLVNNQMQAGSHTVNFDASGLSTGIYFYKIEAGNFIDVKKMSLLK